MRKQKDCPNCRMTVNEVKRNSFISSLIENYIALNPALKRDAKDIEHLEQNKIFKGEVVSGV
jgi:hypothetical protein